MEYKKLGTQGLATENMPTLSLDDLKRDHKNVGVRILFSGLNEVDEVKGTFHANFQVHLWMYCEELVGKSRDTMPFLDPKEWVIFQAKETQMERVVWNPPTGTLSEGGEFFTGDGWVICSLFVKGVFPEDFELERFPFDMQELLVSFRLDSHFFPRKMFLVSVPTGQMNFENGVCVASRLTFNEWRVYQPMGVVMDKAFVDPRNPDAKVGQLTEGARERFTMVFHIERASGHYLRSVYFPIFCSLTMTFLLFGAEVDDVQTKTGTGVTLLLTIIALRFVIDGMLPKVSYSTAAEQYLLFAFTATFVMTFLHTFLPRFCAMVYHPDELSERMNTHEKYLFGSSLIFYILWHLFSASIGYCRYRKTRHGMVLKLV